MLQVLRVEIYLNRIRKIYEIRIVRRRLLNKRMPKEEGILRELWEVISRLAALILRSLLKLLLRNPGASRSTILVGG